MSAQGQEVGPKLYKVKPELTALFTDLRVPHDLIATVAAAAMGLPRGHYGPADNGRSIFRLPGV